MINFGLMKLLISAYQGFWQAPLWAKRRRVWVSPIDVRSLQNRKALLAPKLKGQLAACTLMVQSVVLSKILMMLTSNVAYKVRLILIRPLTKCFWAMTR